MECSSEDQATLGIYWQGRWQRVSGKCSIQLVPGQWVKVEIRAGESDDLIRFRVVEHE
ncbi:MAG: hypothetical protein KDC71_18700 [Acidobacteria bacterium]|nr:hypothetical protein [Acidobacteriota bacterium]